MSYGKNGKVEEVEINIESAVTQLNRYRLLQETWCEQNVSNTISYDPSEIPEIIDWLLENWDCYVGVSFLFRNDPTKNAEDLGYPYLAQEVVTREEWEAYASLLEDIRYDGIEVEDELYEESCSSGACPYKINLTLKYGTNWTRKPIQFVQSFGISVEQLRSILYLYHYFIAA